MDEYVEDAGIQYAIPLTGTAIPILSVGIKGGVIRKERRLNH